VIYLLVGARKGIEPLKLVEEPLETTAITGQTARWNLHHCDSYTPEVPQGNAGGGRRRDPVIWNTGSKTVRTDEVTVDIYHAIEVGNVSHRAGENTEYHAIKRQDTINQHNNLCSAWALWR